MPLTFRGRSRGRVPTGGGIHAMVACRGVRVSVSERCRSRGEGRTSADADADDYYPPDPPAVARMEDEQYTMHSFRVGGAASHNMDGTTMDVLVEYVGWKSATVARRCVGVTVPAAAAGMKRSRERNGIHRGGRPTSVRAVCAFTYGVPTGQLTPNQPGVGGEFWV